MHILGMKTTKEHKEYWKNRKINWNESYLSGIDERTGKPMWDHPHRSLIVYALKCFPWFSLWEVGCGGGANLVKIAREIPGRQLGGCDINADAIKLCQAVLKDGRFHVESVDDMLLSNNSVDVILSDASLIYIGPEKIDKAIHEIVRSARNTIILCEFHSTNWLDRLIFRWKTGYNAYNYKQLLEKHGCYDVQTIKIPKSLWPGQPWEKWGYIITAKLINKL